MALLAVLVLTMDTMVQPALGAKYSGAIVAKPARVCSVKLGRSA